VPVEWKVHIVKMSGPVRGRTIDVDPLLIDDLLIRRKKSSLAASIVVGYSVSRAGFGR
jgi:hypothetical protein